VLGGVLRRDVDRQAGLKRQLDHSAVYTLRMQVQLHPPRRAGQPGEDRAPEIVVPFGHAAFTVNPQRHTRDPGAVIYQHAQRIAAVSRVILGAQTFGDVGRVWAVGPLILLGPDAELEVQTAFRRFSADEAERVQVVLALRCR
jgi:hypothetical protein